MYLLSEAGREGPRLPEGHRGFRVRNPGQWVASVLPWAGLVAKALGRMAALGSGPLGIAGGTALLSAGSLLERASRERVRGIAEGEAGLQGLGRSAKAELRAYLDGEDRPGCQAHQWRDHWLRVHRDGRVAWVHWRDAAEGEGPAVPGARGGTGEPQGQSAGSVEGVRVASAAGRTAPGMVDRRRGQSASPAFAHVSRRERNESVPVAKQNKETCCPGLVLCWGCGLPCRSLAPFFWVMRKQWECTLF